MREAELFSAHGVSVATSETRPPTLLSETVDPNGFWAKVEVGPPDACWRWRGATGARGLPVVWVPALTRFDYAYRVAYDLEVRPLLEGEIVRRRADCDRLCVNPTHLRGDVQAAQTAHGLSAAFPRLSTSATRDTHIEPHARAEHGAGEIPTVSTALTVMMSDSGGATNDHEDGS